MLPWPSFESDIPAGSDQAFINSIVQGAYGLSNIHTLQDGSCVARVGRSQYKFTLAGNELRPKVKITKWLPGWALALVVVLILAMIPCTAFQSLWVVPVMVAHTWFMLAKAVGPAFQRLIRPDASVTSNASRPTNPTTEPRTCFYCSGKVTGETCDACNMTQPK